MTDNLFLLPTDVVIQLSFASYEQITLRQKMGLSRKSLDPVLSRCTKLSSLTLEDITDLSLLSMVVEKGCRIQHLTICGSFRGGSLQLVGILMQ
jgi:hypothetical protein